MGTIAARQTREILGNVDHVITIELLCAAQAYDLLTEHQPMTGGRGTREVYRLIQPKTAACQKIKKASNY